MRLPEMPGGTLCRQQRIHLAKARLDKTTEQRRSPEMDYFMDVFIPSFSLSLDEISLDSSL